MVSEKRVRSRSRSDKRNVRKSRTSVRKRRGTRSQRGGRGKTRHYIKSVKRTRQKGGSQCIDIIIDGPTDEKNINICNSKGCKVQLNLVDNRLRCVDNLPP